MVNVTVSTAGTSGPRGFSWLSGVGVPATNLAGSLDGDFYLDTTNVGYYYGPRTAGLWGTPHPFGNSLNGVPLTNVTATVAPTVSNDGTQGYSKGSYWINTTSGLYYICTSSATGAAVWQQLLPSGGTNSLTITGTPAYGQALVAQSATAAAWQVPPTGLPATGIVTGGLMAVGNPTNTFTFTQATGYIVDYVTAPLSPTITKVTVPAQTVTVSGAAANRVVNWWVSDANGNISAMATRPTDVQRRTLLQLGITGSTPPGGNIFSLQALPVVLNQPQNQLYDLMYALGPFEPTDNVITPNANLTFNKAAGSFFSPSFGWGLASGSTPNDPHVVTAPAESPAQFLYALRTAGSETTTPTSAFDPLNYDNAGVKTAVGGGTNSSTVQRLWVFGSGTVADQMIVQYGQTVYSSLSAAVSSIGTTGYVSNPDFVGIGCVTAWICTTRICTSLADSANCTILTAAKFAVP